MCQCNSDNIYKMEEKERHARWWIILGSLLVFSHQSLADTLQAPRFITQPSNSGNIVPEGRIKILQCQALGYPQPKYRWIKDGQPLGDFTTELFYRIHSTRREDAGSYQCVAKNDVGSIFSQKSDVTVAYMGSFEDLSEQVLSVESGSAAILDLPPIESHPSPSVAWLSDGGPLPYDRKFAITSKNQLVILSVSSSDQRAYRARATNTQLGKEELSGFTRLIVTGDDHREIPPEIVVKPENVNVIKGGALPHELQCISNARPLHELETLWLKDNILLENAGVAYQFNDPWNNTLSLLSPNLTHTGRYSCQVRLRSGGYPTVSASADVVVLEKPIFATPMRAETLGEFGSAQTLPCEASGIPAPNITWFRNTLPLPLTSKQYSVREDGALLIRSVGIDDTGMFQCVAVNDAGEDSQYTWLKVKTAAPVLTEPPVNVTVLDGKDAIINCRALGAPVPNITWIYRDSGYVEPSARVQILENGDLLLADSREGDAGKYTCIRANEAGSVQGSAHLAILVRTQIVQPPVDTRVLLGHTATLQCKISSDPTVPFNLFWYHNDEVITAGSNARYIIHEDGTLEIQAVRASDVGEYSCALHSPGGNETRSARLSVIELPFPPSHVSAKRVPAGFQRAVNVSWTPGFDGNSPILQYVIQRLEVADAVPLPDALANWVTEVSNVSTTARWVLLTNLKAAASYQFRVSAINSVGEGPPSEPSNIVALPQEAPSGPPLSFVGSARSSSEIILQWQQPLEEHRNGQILGYIIRFRLYGYNESPWTLRNITNEAQKTYLITDLITWKEYIVQIAAYNNKGVGYFSKDLRIKTREGVPEAPPVDVRATAVNSTCVRVTWRPPDPQKINGINLGYRIQAWIGKDEAKSIRVAPSLVDPWAEQAALMSGLEKFTNYNMTVLCFTDPGDGKRSIPVSIKTNEDVPEEIASLQFSNVSDRAVKVLWTPPLRSNGILRGYSVIYSLRDKPETSKVLNFSSEVLEVMVEHLQATTHYKFEVSAWTSVGRGPSRIATIQSGVEPVLPHPPTRLAVTNIEAFSVVLQFTPGFDGNSSITRWIVEGQTARNSSWFVVTELTDPDASTITVTDLVPFTTYRLRVKSRNVVGVSEPSEPTKEFQTIQAPPAHPPRNVTVRAMSATELRVRWIPLQQSEWFGNPSGYHILFTELGTGAQKEIVIEDATVNSHILEHLEEFALYEVTMNAFNEVGSSDQSPSAVERTREFVPTFGPLSVEANATSSTTIVVKWGDVPKEHQNGLIEGYKVYYAANARPPFLSKTISSNSTFTTTLTELKKFVVYHIQVMAYTRLGEGALSVPPVRVQTFEDTPGPPSNVSFPDVSFTTARIIWDVPTEPNGQILAYRVDYHMDALPSINMTREFPPSDRTFRATGLEAEQYYLFSVTAQTSLGWGKTANALVFTTNNRETPQPPSAPQVSRSQIQSERITFSWTPGRDGFAPLRYYTVQQSVGKGAWVTIPEKVDPQLMSYTAVNLKPFTSYRFRIQASNDIGASGWSQESSQVRTSPAAPSRGVTNLKVVPITVSSVRVQWTPVDESFWSGDQDTGGYRVIYQPASDFPTPLQDTPKEDIYGIRKDRIVLSDLTRDKNYEIIVVPFNSQGDGPPSPPVTVYVGEAVPTGQPRDLQAEPVSSTEVRLKWSPPVQSQQNGDLLGYKIFYLVTDAPQESDRKTEEEIEVVPATYTTHSLVFLDKYTQYRIQMLAFNPAGDGPRSNPVSVRTQQGLPGPPANLTFSDITMSSLMVSWKPPRKRNGDIVGYIVTYETMGRNEQFSKQVRQVSETNLVVTGLEEEIPYLFTVRAKTLDLGPALVGNVTTGPQEGSPGRPKDLQMGKTVSSVDLHWTNGNSGKGPILGYYIQSKRKDDTRWQIVTKSNNGPLQDFTISYQNLLPSTSYNFRVIAYNKYGISYPVYADDMILTPSKLYLEYGYLQQKPFYRQTWFMVALAACSIVIIIMVIAVLCVKSKTYKYKREYEEATKTLEESMTMDDRQERDFIRNRHMVESLSRRPQIPLGKSPPRPSPASVAYHSDEESLKGYDENPDDSSLTEKPSEMSSTDSQSDTENESVRSDPHSFVNHYANVNDTLRPAWKKQKPFKTYSSHTDSEPESSAVVSLNGGQIILNNMARSRAPLPGYSSFV